MATRSSSKGGKRSSAATRKKNAAQKRARQQIHAVILFALGIFLTALALVEGVSLWRWLHNALFGLFGLGAVALILLLFYIAVLLTKGQKVQGKAICGAVLVVLICGALQIFQMGVPRSVDINLLEMLVECITEGIALHSGGLAGTLVGLPLLLYCGKVGGGIVIVLLVFVFLMILTGGTLIGLARAAKQPVKHLEETYADQMLQQEQRRAQRPPHPPKEQRTPAAAVPIQEPVSRTSKKPQKHKFSIDIPIDDDFDPAQAGGFSLMPEDDAMQYVPPAPSAQEKTSPPVEEEGFHFNLPPEVKESDSQETEAPLDWDKLFSQPMSDLPDASAEPEPEEDVPSPEETPSQEASASSAPEELEPAAPPVVYQKPPLSLLREPKRKRDGDLTEELKQTAQRLVDTLASFGVQTRIVDIARGPAVTRYELQPSAGVKISKITNLADDIALNLASAGVRIEAPIPNKAAVGIEVPNKTVSAVSIREILDSPEFQNAPSRLSAALGRDIAGNIVVADIAKMPHLLIAGSTGSGKSVCINSIIVSLLYKSTPDEVRFLMIDPKVVELGVYNGIPQLLVPVVTDPKKAAGALSWAVTEMLKRYKLFADNSVRDLSSYNHLAERTEGMEPLPQVVIIIDELADLMMAAPNEIEDYICRLAQMARAAGMHLIIATQRPSVDVITGVIKANIPSRIAFAVSSQVDSRTILDMGGAEKLLGRGDMLFNPVGNPKPTRVQGCFVTDEEIEAVIDFIKRDSTAAYDETVIEEIDNHVVASKGSKSGGDAGETENAEDEMLLPAIEVVVEAGMASTSLLQRRLKLGYARAARIVDEMEAKGIVGPFEGSKPRQVLISKERWMEMKLNQQS